MKNIIFKTIEAAANSSGAMDAGNHFTCASRSASKNGACSKSLMSRGNILRKIHVIAIAATISVAVYAQQGKMGIGFHGALTLPLDRTSAYKIDRLKTVEYKSALLNYGIGGKLQYNVTDPIRVEGLFSYFIGMTELTALTKSGGWNDATVFFFSTDLSVNAHYRFSLDNLEKIYAYPLMGVTFFKATDRLIATSSSLIPVHIDEKIRKRSGAGLNIGCGFERNVKDRIRTFSELKYSIVGDGLNRVTLSAGLVFLF